MKTISDRDIRRFICDYVSDSPLAGCLEKPSPSEWERIITIAIDEGMGSLLYRALKEKGVEQELPDAALSALSRSYYTTTAYNALLADELKQILAALTTAGIPVLLLKGAVLAPTLYQDPGLRPMTDLDLMVPRESMEHALSAVGQLGYRRVLVEHQAQITRLVDANLILRGGPGESVSLELHWNLVGGEGDLRTAPASWFWTNSELFPPDNRVRMLSPSAHLLFLAAHLVLRHEGGSRLIWLYDLHSICRQWADALDWNLILDRAFAFGWAGALRFALDELTDLFNTALPLNVLEVLPASIPTGNGGQETRFSETWRALSYLNPKTRLALAFALIFPRPAFIHWRYSPSPHWLWPLFYPIRWIDFMLDGLRTIFSHPLNREGVNSAGR